MDTAFIPTKIKVGYQKRRDTYSGKLAYVIYYDEKNKLRKEPSWQNWRDKAINDDEFNNEYLEGFVLNKKAGDYADWYHRQAYIRVFDPRGFEIEITLNNLLYILENCNSIKGKGLEGRFCYGYVGTDLVLIPENSQLNIDSKKYSDLLFNKKSVKKDELIVGETYLLGKKKVVYLGYHPHFYSWYEKAIVVYDGNEHYWCDANIIDTIDWKSEHNYWYLNHSKNFKPLSSFNDIKDITEPLNVIQNDCYYNGEGYEEINQKDFAKFLKQSKESLICLARTHNDKHFQNITFKKLNNDEVSYIDETIGSWWYNKEMIYTVKELYRSYVIPVRRIEFVNGNVYKVLEDIKIN